ncbi:hypothetical protein PVAP13_9NG258400 [Panicum virgatum]|uniref:Uncharacterized protein n=1 Tax=Panicum virgatum TaxID=38727 RepID=A0A8T0MRA8_PANVG|nr:hypothetical protein PVAP13_9NG258400 [Panicum virgatum]
MPFRSIRQRVHLMLARSPLTTWMLMATMVRILAAQTLITFMAATNNVETMNCLMMQLD